MAETVIVYVEINNSTYFLNLSLGGKIRYVCYHASLSKECR